MKLLLVDVGNSQTVVGVHDGGEPRTWLAASADLNSRG